MRIISKFSDFYDGIQRMGQDQDRVYVRHTSSYNLCQTDEEKIVREKYPQFINLRNSIKSRTEGTYSSGFDFVQRRHVTGMDHTYNLMNISRSFLLFCGELIPLIVLWQDRYNLHEAKKSLVLVDAIYPGESYTNSLEKYFYPDSLNFQRRFSQETRIQKFERQMNELEAITKNRDRLTNDVLIEMDVPVALYMMSGNLILNPNLSGLSLYKQKDSFQVFQSIDQYLGNNLVKQMDGMENISNDDIKHAKGFGHKYAFRAEPGKKKRKKGTK